MGFIVIGADTIIGPMDGLRPLYVGTYHLRQNREYKSNPKPAKRAPSALGFPYRNEGIKVFIGVGDGTAIEITKLLRPLIDKLTVYAKTESAEPI